MKCAISDLFLPLLCSGKLTAEALRLALLCAVVAATLPCQAQPAEAEAEIQAAPAQANRPRRYVLLPLDDDGRVVLPDGNTWDVRDGPALFLTAGGEEAFSRTTPPAAAPAANKSQKYVRRIERYRNLWNALIPDHGILQYAGSMGAVSTGFGWEYGYYGGFRHFSTDIQLGLIPKFSDASARWTLTLKEDFYPAFIHLGRGFYFLPVTSGMYITTVFGSDYWTKEPDKYPKGYYWFSTRCRLNAYIGEEITWVIPDHRRRFAAAVALFYELSVNDFGLVQYASNSYLKLKDILHLSVGLRTQWF